MLSLDEIEITPIKRTDSWKVCDFVVANSDRLKRFFPKTLEQNLNPTLSKLFVENKVCLFEKKEEFLFTIKLSESRELVGLIFIKELDWRKKRGEFAYCIGYNYEGKGIITKSVQCLTQHAFDNLGLETLQIIVHRDHKRSIHVAKHNNFKWQRTLKNEFTPKNELPLDMELFEFYKSTKNKS